MATLRKARAYSKKKVVPFTRVSKKRSKSFIKTVPPQKIVKFTMGNTELYNKGKLSYGLKVVMDEKCQIRHNSMEACRQYLNKKLTKDLSGIFILKIIPFPHHIQRENKMLTGAGADRMQTGMQLSFGKSSGKAAIVNKGDSVFYIAVADEKAVAYVRKLIKQIKPKLPCKIKVLYEKK